MCWCFVFFFQAEDAIRYLTVTRVQPCALPFPRADPPRTPGRGAPNRPPRRLRSCRSARPATARTGCRGGSPQPRRYGRRCGAPRSEEHTSELQSQSNLVCRLLLEKKKKTHTPTTAMTPKPCPANVHDTLQI